MSPLTCIGENTVGAILVWWIHRVMEEDVVAFVEGWLLSKSATTGWFDWMHGELWLFPDGLLRIPRGWGKTLLMGGYVFNPRRAQPRAFSHDERMGLIARRRNVWIPFAELQQATLRHSMGADELVVTLANGQRKQLLWLPHPMVYSALEQVLSHMRLLG